VLATVQVTTEPTVTRLAVAAQTVTATRTLEYAQEKLARQDGLVTNVTLRSASARTVMLAAENGKCVAPNYCVCGESGAQVVGLKRTYDGIEGINCVSLRRDGIKGAGIALIVMFVSISTCGLIAEKNRK